MCPDSTRVDAGQTFPYTQLCIVLPTIWPVRTDHWLEWSPRSVQLHQAIRVLSFLARLCQIHNPSLDQLFQILIKRLHTMCLTGLNR